jgi:hypothetical protein
MKSIAAAMTTARAERAEPDARINPRSKIDSEEFSERPKEKATAKRLRLGRIANG